MFNQVVFVVRYCSNTKLGVQHFDIYRQVTKDVLAQFPEKLEYGINLNNMELRKSLSQVAKRGRGRGRNVQEGSLRGGHYARGTQRRNINP